MGQDSTTRDACSETGDLATRKVSRLDLDSFPGFAPLLEACQDYTAHTGFRFRNASFDGIDHASLEDKRSVKLAVVSSSRAKDPGPLLAAKLRAFPAVRAFEHRLKTPAATSSDTCGVDDAALMDELKQAFQIVMAESARSMMIGTCKQLNMFPPHDAVDIAEDDYDYEDFSASFPEIAQRLHNDHMRRTPSDEANGSWLRQRVMTAAFLVEFAEEVGVVAIQRSEEHQAQLRGVGEFEARVHEWTRQKQSAVKASAPEKIRERIDNHASHAGEFFSKWIAEDWTSALWATAKTVAAGAGAAAAANRFRPRPISGRAVALRHRQQRPIGLRKRT